MAQVIISICFKYSILGLFAFSTLFFFDIKYFQILELPDQRNVLIESARISRGAVEKLSDLKATSDIDAVVFPGGFGAAKNLSDFAFKGTDMTVDPEVERVLKEFNKSGKPIALCCIAPILAAKVFGSQVYILTITSNRVNE